jgi:hypothetical protein
MYQTATDSGRLESCLLKLFHPSLIPEMLLLNMVTVLLNWCKRENSTVCVKSQQNALNSAGFLFLDTHKNYGRNIDRIKMTIVIKILSAVDIFWRRFVKVY